MLLISRLKYAKPAKVEVLILGVILSYHAETEPQPDSPQ